MQRANGFTAGWDYWRQLNEGEHPARPPSSSGRSPGKSLIAYLTETRVTGHYTPATGLWGWSTPDGMATMHGSYSRGTMEGAFNIVGANFAGVMARDAYEARRRP